MNWTAEVRRFVRFTSLGAIGTVAHYAVLVGVVELAGLDAAVASGIGFFLGAVINYSLSRAFVFDTDRSHGVVFSKFLLVALGGLLITVIAMHLLVEILGLNYLISQILITGGLVLWHYVMNRIWSFRR
jgi:putative flippase GtrA